MKKLLALLCSFSLLAFIAGCPSEKKPEGTGGVDAKFPKPTLEVTQDGKAEIKSEVKVEGKDLTVDKIDPKEKGVTAKLDGDKLWVMTAKDAPEGKVMITVKGKGKDATLTVTVKHKAEVVTPPPTKDPIKLASDKVEVKEEGGETVKVTDGKAKSADVDPKDSKVKATVIEEGKAVKVEAEKGAKDATVTVMGVEGTATIKVTIKK